MRITIEQIKSVSSAMRPNSAAVAVDCDMTESQMFNALLQFLEYISGPTWAEWVREIDADAKADA